MPASRVGDKSEPKMTKADAREVESEVLSAIQSESHRTAAIVNILRGRYDYNSVLRALVNLQKEGKVEKESKKAWIAKGKQSGKGKEGDKEKK